MYEDQVLLPCKGKNAVFLRTSWKITQHSIKLLGVGTGPVCVFETPSNM